MTSRSELPANLLQQGFEIEHDSAVKNLRRALLDVQTQVERLLADLDDPKPHEYGGTARSMAASAGEAARHAGELDMAGRLAAFLLPALGAEEV